MVSRQIIDDSDYNSLDEDWKIDVSTCMVLYILSCSMLMILFYLLIIKKDFKRIVNKYSYFK